MQETDFVKNNTSPHHPNRWCGDVFRSSVRFLSLSLALLMGSLHHAQGL